MTPRGDHRDEAPTKRFVRLLDGFERTHRRDEHFRDFLELACCAVRKRTVPAGPAADVLEARYVAIVARHAPEDIRAMPELLALIQFAVAGGGCDFLGDVAGEIGALDGRSGQFFTPYHVSRLMAEMALQDVDSLVAAHGFVTLCEPACGAGGMVLAAADVVEAAGHLPALSLFVEATDISTLAFHMAYLQLACRGVPALVRRADSLSGEEFDRAFTPAMLPFLERHGEAFEAWCRRSAEHTAFREQERRKGEQLALL